MPGRKKQKKAKKPANQGSWGNIQLGSFRASFPQPRLPKLLGSATKLGAQSSVYPIIPLDLPMVQQTVLVATGAMAGVVPIDKTIIQAFATRFASTFREYAIVGARFEVRVNNAVAPAGVASCFIDEESASVPTATDALDRPRIDVLIAAQTVPGSYRLDWIPRDILDLDYTAIGTTFTPAYLKLYTNVADFGALAGTSAQVIVTGALAFVFRGFV
jgi:hypothetical protein